LIERGKRARSHTERGDDISAEDIRAVIVDGKVEKLVEVAKKTAEKLVRGKVETSQMRKSYQTTSNVREYDENVKRQLYLLLPKLAYQSKRHPGLKTLHDIFEKAIPLIDDEGKFENFKDLFEAIVAYHKAYERGD